MILLIELLLVAGAGAVALSWWMSLPQRTSEGEGQLPELPDPAEPPVGSVGRLRWLLKEGRLSDAAREAGRKIGYTAPVTKQVSGPASEPTAGEAAESVPLSRSERRLLTRGERLAALKAYLKRTGAPLEQAMELVDRPARAGEAEPHELTADEKNLLKEGMVISVIKLVRDRTGLSLLEAKDRVEAAQKELGL